MIPGMRRNSFGSRPFPKQPFRIVAGMHDREVSVSCTVPIRWRPFERQIAITPTNTATYTNRCGISAAESCCYGQQIALPVGLFLGILSTWQARFNFAA